ncbi:hypothetical protein BLA6860_05968 [Burkholderia lata]|uniref:hypothetical protein n=1 Tax=Burkholderia lata (strain ATCC 17760 / DSM 23089 / LMG 22485 / NCIMB 9086 / R18194 / 383) TaxID=482957 RepID=UPI0014530E5B|nr:hypothetical protein [Burkholderia lata]VWC23935.1 hypothetical protein BLA6860_05968 [Burkholderia lata]
MNSNSGRAFAWTEIDQVPETPGVYAWYAKLIISTADINSIIDSINLAKASNLYEAKKEVESALDRFVFNPYREAPYRVQLRGALKPRYGGDVSHEPSKSENLIERLVAEPERLRKIADVLASAAPGFTAPLYIGMAVNLRTRLRTHKRKITELRDVGHASVDSTEILEAGFANQVVARGFDPTNLFVVVADVDVDTGEHNDLENILNRINFPIFGRN